MSPLWIGVFFWIGVLILVVLLVLVLAGREPIGKLSGWRRVHDNIDGYFQWRRSHLNPPQP